MGLRYRIPLPGPFYYSGRVGLPRSSSSGCGPMGLIVKFVVYPSIVCFGVALAIMIAPFYGLFWVVRRWQRNRWGRQPVGPWPPRSAVSAAVSGCAPCFEVVWFRPG